MSILKRSNSSRFSMGEWSCRNNSYASTPSSLAMADNVSEVGYFMPHSILLRKVIEMFAFSARFA
jgi:hypothetical protein